MGAISGHNLEDGGAMGISVGLVGLGAFGRQFVDLFACHPTVDRVALGGERLASDTYELWSPFGRTRVVLPARTCDATRPLQAEVRYRPQPP
jgi:hypothetical protein